MSERTARLDELLREEISAIIGREIADPRIGFVTVTSVDVTSDLGHATVWVSVIGDAATRRAAVGALGRSMPFVRHRLGVLRLKRIPELHVREDDTAERGTRLLHILDELEHGEPVEDVAAEVQRDLPAPAPIRGVPEPRSKRRRRPHAEQGGQRGH
jgi:ribosome-binding factor A